MNISMRLKTQIKVFRMWMGGAPVLIHFTSFLNTNDVIM